MSAQTSRGVGEGKTRPPGRPTCDWPCDRPAVKHEGGWWHCAEHLKEHRALEGPPPSGVEQQVRELNLAGLNDTQIARELGLSVYKARVHRIKLGLPVRGISAGESAAEHGTVARARWHYRHKIPLCGPCRQADNSRCRDEAYPSGQKRWAS